MCNGHYPTGTSARSDVAVAGPRNELKIGGSNETCKEEQGTLLVYQPIPVFASDISLHWASRADVAPGEMVP
jgi:hypothetical protein